LGITGALTTAFWGVLLCFYTLLALKDPVDVNFGMTIGSTVIFLSALSGLLLIASRHEFERHAS
jgi:hypothetical protein